MYVNQAIEHKIIKGKFVNISFLLVRDPTNSQTIPTSAIDSQSNIIAQPKQSNKIISI